MRLHGGNGHADALCVREDDNEVMKMRWRGIPGREGGREGGVFTRPLVLAAALLYYLTEQVAKGDVFSGTFMLWVATASRVKLCKLPDSRRIAAMNTPRQYLVVYGDPRRDLAFQVPTHALPMPCTSARARSSLSLSLFILLESRIRAWGVV